MKYKFVTFFCTLILCTFSVTIFAQAGLGLRHLQSYPMHHGLMEQDTLFKRYEFGIHYRWFDSAIPYSGSQRQHQLERDNFHEIFNSHNAVVSLGYRINKRLSFTVNVPFVFNQKSSVLEHSMVSGTIIAHERRVTEAIGLGDIFVMGNFHLINPDKGSRYTLIAGLGVKIPTGEFQALDIWHNAGPNRTDVLRPVDPEIQPGDGAWGYILDIRGAASIMPWLGAYFEGRYLASPTNTNGTFTFRSTISDEFSQEEEVSVSDQYMARSGITLAMPGAPVQLSLGVRVDGTPVNDLIGDSEGFRRPGFATSFDTGVTFRTKSMNYYLSIPYIYYQNRERSNTDKNYTAATGEYRHGYTAFSRVMILAGIQSSF